MHRPLPHHDAHWTLQGAINLYHHHTNETVRRYDELKQAILQNAAAADEKSQAQQEAQANRAVAKAARREAQKMRQEAQAARTLAVPLPKVEDQREWVEWAAEQRKWWRERMMRPFEMDEHRERKGKTKAKVKEGKEKEEVRQELYMVEEQEEGPRKDEIDWRAQEDVGIEYGENGTEYGVLPARLGPPTRRIKMSSMAQKPWMGDTKWVNEWTREPRGGDDEALGV